MELRGFEVLAPLGSGQFGDVLLVRRAVGGELLAAKIVRGESAEAAAAARREAELLQALRHLNVVRCVEVVQSGTQLAIVMEYASGGDLDGYIRASKQQYDKFKRGSSSGRLLTVECTSGRGLGEIEAMRIFLQIALALAYLHERRIIHRDLKPKVGSSVYTRPLINSNGTGDSNSTQNILLDGDGVVKLSDFGVSKPLERTSDGANTVIGTPFYMAPEVLEGSVYDTKCDVWSLGCVLYEMAAMSPPFVGSAVGAVVYQILEKEPPQLPKRFSQGFHSLVTCLLTKNPSLRPDVRMVLQSDFVQGHMMRLVCAATFSQPQMIEQIDNTSRSYGSQNEIPEEDAALDIVNRVVPLSHFLKDGSIGSNENTNCGGDLARQIFFKNKVAAKKNQERADDEWSTSTVVAIGDPVQLQVPSAKCAQQKLGFEPIYDHAANARAALINKQKILEDLGRYEKSIEIGIETTSRSQSAQTPPLIAPLRAPTLRGKEQSKDEYEKMLEAERLHIRAETKALQERMRAMRVASKENH